MAFVRASKAQAELFRRNAAQASGAPRPQHQPGQKQPRQQKRREDLPENMVEKQINDFLKHHHWILIRQHVGLFEPWRVHTPEPIRMGEEGMSDWAAVRVMEPGDAPDFFYYEAKGSGRTPSPKQRKWLEDKAARGFMCAWFDDYDGDWPSSFLPWYKARFGG